MSSQSPSSSALPVAVTLAFVLALPSRAHAMAPPEPATVAPIVVVEEAPPVAADPQLVVPPAPQRQADPVPPPLMAVTLPDSQRRTDDLSPRAKHNDGLGLTIAGFSTFGASYAIGLLGSVGSPLAAIPVAGPMIIGAQLIENSPSALFPVMGAVLGVGFMLDGVAQVVGLGLGVTGAVKLGNSRHQARLSATGGGLRLQF